MTFHNPVMVNEVLHYLNLHDAGVYVDCTLGGGGHLAALAETAPAARFIGLDADPEAIQFARRRLDHIGPRLQLVLSNFRHLDTVLAELGANEVDGIIFDLGVSLHQLTTATRGFSYDTDGPLDMRMDPAQPQDAARLVRNGNYETIREILKDLGEVHNPGKIAWLIDRQKHQLKTTGDLQRLVAQAVPRRYLKKNLAQVFQALRIAVNDELGNLSQGLEASARLLKKKDASW